MNRIIPVLIAVACAAAPADLFAAGRPSNSGSGRSKTPKVVVVSSPGGTRAAPNSTPAAQMSAPEAGSARSATASVPLLRDNSAGTPISINAAEGYHLGGAGVQKKDSVPSPAQGGSSGGAVAKSGSGGGGGGRSGSGAAPNSAASGANAAAPTGTTASDDDLGLRNVTPAKRDSLLGTGARIP